MPCIWWLFSPSSYSMFIQFPLDLTQRTSDRGCEMVAVLSVTGNENSRSHSAGTQPWVRVSGLPFTTVWGGCLTLQVHNDISPSVLTPVGLVLSLHPSSVVYPLFLFVCPFCPQDSLDLLVFPVLPHTHSLRLGWHRVPRARCSRDHQTRWSP